MRSTLAAGARSVAIGRGSADQSVRTAASSPTGSSLKRRSAKDNMRAEAASIHGRSSTMTRTARLLVRRRNSVSTAVAVVRGSAGPQLVAGAWFGVLPGVVLAAAVPAARRSWPPGPFRASQLIPRTPGDLGLNRESGQDRHPELRCDGMAFTQQGRLADSGFALDKENSRASSKLTEETGDLGSLCIPAYEHRLHLCCQLQPGDGIVNGAPGELPGHQRRPQSCWSWPRHRTAIVVERHSPHDRYDGSPSHPAGRDSNSPPSGPNSLFKRGVNIRGGGALLPMPGYQDFRCGSGNHLREPPCKLSQAP